MKIYQRYSLNIALILLSLISFTAIADDLDTDDFIERASAASAAEIELGMLALKESKSNEVKQFAQHMIDDHKAANVELQQIAESKNAEFNNSPSLLNKTKKEIMEMREGTSFDLAYASNQVRAHEQTVDLFTRASRSSDPDIKAYADKYLPTLKSHLLDARELVQTTERADHEAGNDDFGAGSVPPTNYQ